MSERTLHLLAYDVRNPRRLRRALEVARRYAVGGQKSAHECFLTDAEVTALMRAMESVTETREDAVFLVRLDPRSKPRTLGIATPPADGRILYIG